LPASFNINVKLVDEIRYIQFSFQLSRIGLFFGSTIQ